MALDLIFEMLKIYAFSLLQKGGEKYHSKLQNSMLYRVCFYLRTRYLRKRELLQNTVGIRIGW